MSEPQTEARPALVLNGPNLGRLGKREPAIYGSTNHDELAALCVAAGQQLGLDVTVRQSESEADLLRWLHEAADASIPVVLNAGAYSHTSIALRDACSALTAPLIEVHISNIHAREEFRHHSHLSAVATGVIVGLGVQGYVLALSWLSATPSVRG
jgi:3-dehydroquinate dehydratase-2